MNYYNEFDAGAAAWLRELINRKLIPDGIVDTRSITDVQPDDLKPYTQCHFFAGIAGWSLALRLAGWPDDRSVWTGSCPCQPFSCAGRQLGTEDERHLWPVFHRLIAQCRPPVVFGEQVASKAGREWLAGVRTDLEALAYAVGAADLCAAGVSAPIRRQRLYWVAESCCARLEGFTRHGDEGKEPGRHRPEAGGHAAETGTPCSRTPRVDEVPMLRRVDLHEAWGTRARLRVPTDRGVGGGPLLGWERFDALPCADGWRRVEPGSFPLAHGVPARVVRLRGYGNAIVPPLAAEFSGACLGIDGGSPVVSDDLL